MYCKCVLVIVFGRYRLDAIYNPFTKQILFRQSNPMTIKVLTVIDVKRDILKKDRFCLSILIGFNFNSSLTQLLTPNPFWQDGLIFSLIWHWKNNCCHQLVNVRSHNGNLNNISPCHFSAPITAWLNPDVAPVIWCIKGVIPCSIYWLHHEVLSRVNWTPP